ncbi:lipoprotein-releasing ABC transporter permease subunit [Halieaceae bacterium IMCC14734]|uniref:Lipoprotein-releasing ABC transporter permease subunit n=1 Tax=Candidatus Litorirhabdus singularis TaxID=2518993 RepID=A0ABT3TGH8_9GAMM|nr:lipoprotein-releasing ABC transporter permease subunit [Candidatus Litorirhabdus singularis]MCX2981418.1 lipoprotein-releasing ABC transporter permease subunit [Candidatus Litorirhabdus singularis]
MRFWQRQLPLYIGTRYSFSRQRTRFIGVVSMVSLLGMAIGVASLIVVLSVMNGFGGELRDRILTLVSHAEIRAETGDLEAWSELTDTLQENPSIVGFAPFIETKVLLASQRQVAGAQLVAIDPRLESAVSAVADNMLAGKFSALEEQRYGIVLGSLLARGLGLNLGDSVEVTVPRLTLTPLGAYPRTKRFEVVGVFSVGAQLDSNRAYIALGAGQKLLSLGDAVHGLRLQFADLYAAPRLSRDIAEELGPGFQVRDWEQTQRSLFSAVRMEKTMITVLLMSVVAVAAFNIVSTLTMAITEKRGDIAVLRTMGISARSVMAIFMAQGLVLASVGVAVGALVGVLLALNISEAVALLEQLFGFKVFDPQVYFISNLPADLQWRDVLLIVGSALLLSLLATLVPAWRATRIAPAEVLRYG